MFRCFSERCRPTLPQFAASTVDRKSVRKAALLKENAVLCCLFNLFRNSWLLKKSIYKHPIFIQVFKLIWEFTGLFLLVGSKSASDFCRVRTSKLCMGQDKLCIKEQYKLLIQELMFRNGLLGALETTTYLRKCLVVFWGLSLTKSNCFFSNICPRCLKLRLDFPVLNLHHQEVQEFFFK